MVAILISEFLTIYLIYLGSIVYPSMPRIWWQARRTWLPRAAQHGSPRKPFVEAIPASTAWHSGQPECLTDNQRIKRKGNIKLSISTQSVLLNSKLFYQISVYYRNLSWSLPSSLKVTVKELGNFIEVWSTTRFGIWRHSEFWKSTVACDCALGSAAFSSG